MRFTGGSASLRSPGRRGTTFRLKTVAVASGMAASGRPRSRLRGRAHDSITAIPRDGAPCFAKVRLMDQAISPTTLRIILAVAGVLVLAAIYFFGRPGREQGRRILL